MKVANGMDTRCQEAIAALRHEVSVEIARTRAQLSEAKALRHIVFCKERGYLPELGTSESDEFDCRSHHVVLRDRRSGEVIGTVRLIVPRLEWFEDSLPMQRVAPAQVLSGLPLHATAEISRFCLSRNRRDTSQLSDPMKRLGLVQGVLRLSRELGITHWCAIMEPSLLRLLRGAGIHFEARGPMVEYHGLRQPSVGCIETILDRGRLEKPELWAFVTEGQARSRRCVPDRLAA